MCDCGRVVPGKPFGEEWGNPCWTCWGRLHDPAENKRVSGPPLVPWFAGPVAPVTVVIPEPPPVIAVPTRDRVVVTAAIGEPYRRMLETTGPTIREYADRHGADYLELDWQPEYPFAVKFQLARVLDLWETVTFFDCDVLCPPAGFDLFGAVPRGSFGFFDDGPDLVRRDREGILREYQTVREMQGLPRRWLEHYANTGVMVFDRSHRAVFTPPPKPLLVSHCSEQHWLVSMLHETGVPTVRLPREANWRWDVASGGFLFPPPPTALLHFIGLTGQPGDIDTVRGYKNAIGRPII